MDPGTALGVASLAYDVVKDLYEYYKAWKSCDKDVADLRAHLLWLQAALKATKDTLNRPGLSAEQKSLVESTVISCQEATQELSSILQKIRSKDVQPTTALQKLRAEGRKAAYPFKKSTVQNLAGNVGTCSNALHLATDLVGLNATTTSLEKLRALDRRIVNELDSFEDAFRQFQLDQKSREARLAQTIERQTSRVQFNIEASRNEAEYVHKAILERHDKLEGILKTAEDRQRAQQVIDSLDDKKLHRRRGQVRDAHEATFEWILDESKSDFAKWLKKGSGLYWIRGKAGSGKSTLMKFLIDHEQTEDLLHDWATPHTLLIVEHFFWVSGTLIQKSYQGLLRSLLCQVLQAQPDLVPLACKRRWNSPHTAPQEWATKELVNALYRRNSEPQCPHMHVHRWA